VGIDSFFKEKRLKTIIEVKDEGIGIRKSDLPYIFNRFYRVDGSRTKNKVEGYGLGLAIAKNIVDTYKGKIEVESEVGKGSVFRVIV
jgi:signal transduction histidine kinase